MFEESAKLHGKRLETVVCGDSSLQLDNVVSLRLHTLPWQKATKKVDENVCEGLHIVPSSELQAQVTINGCEISGSYKAKTIVVWNMYACLGIPELLRQPKINEVHHVGLLADAHNDVGRFEITVNEVARMDILQATELDIAR
jgi:hypothetical protein